MAEQLSSPMPTPDQAIVDEASRGGGATDDQSVAPRNEQPLAPSIPQGHIPVYNIEGKEPILGSLHQDEVTEAIASGNYSLPASGPVKVISPDGQMGTLDPAEAPEAFKNGYKYATDRDQDESTYGGGLEQLKAGIEGVGQGVAGPLFSGAERALFGNAEEQRKRAEVNPIAHGVGEAIGLTGSMLTGVGEGALALKAGAKAAEAVGLGEHALEGASFIHKVGSAAVRGAAENAIIASGDEASKAIQGGDTSGAIADIGLAGLIGGTISGGIGAVSPLWKATLGKSTNGVLKAVSDRLGGIEGQVVGSHIDEALAKSGLADTIAPEVRAAMSSDPHIKELASVLEQTDTNGSGKAFQEAVSGFRKRVGEVQAEALGQDISSIPAKGEINKYEAGKNLGKTMSQEWEEKIGPLSKQYEEYASKFQGKDLIPSLEDRVELSASAQDDAFGRLQKSQKELQKALKSGSPERAIEAEAALRESEGNLKAVREAAKKPGTVDDLTQKIMDRAEKEGWNSSPSSDIMREVNRVVKELPAIKTLKGLSSYIQQIGENTRSTLPFGQQTPVSRAGAILKTILRDAESSMIGNHIGSEEGVDALAAYRATQQAYAKAAQLHDAIDSRLHAGGSTRGYAKALAGMAQQKGERMLERLSSLKDADFLATIKSEFPKTAQALREHHVQSLLSGVKEGEEISSKKLMTSLSKMSPQVREFIMSPEADAKIKAAHSLLDALNDQTHNFSNTGRTVNKLLEHIPGAGIAMAGMLTGHNPALSFLFGTLANKLGKDVPDAIRLGLLKFLGSDKPIDSAAFKSMYDYIHNTIKGENLMSRASKAVFKSSVEVLPQSILPTASDRNKIDKAVQKIQLNPAPLLNAGSGLSHYLPDHAANVAGNVTTATQYLAGIRPKTDKPGILDENPKVTPGQKAEYNNALNIAHQPLIVLDKIKMGNITPRDIAHLQNMYPNVYQNLSQKLMDQVIHAQSKGEVIPYKTRIGLSMFMAQPMDSTMNPASILAAQPKQSGAAQAQQQPQEAPKRSTSALNKLPKAAMTRSQASEERLSGNNN